MAATPRAQLRPMPRQKSFADVMREALALHLALKDMRRPERLRLNAAAYVKEALALAHATLEEIVELDVRLRNLPESQEARPAQRFVTVLTEMACDFYGTFTPVAANFPYTRTGHTMGEVVAACAELKVSRMALAAVSALRATEAAPRIFAEGCDDAGKHEEKLRAMEAQLDALLVRASHAFTLQDLRFDVINPGGACKVSFALSNGEVGVMPPGNSSGPRALVAWLERHQQDEDET